jgi:hypothetical protein
MRICSRDKPMRPAYTHEPLPLALRESGLVVIILLFTRSRILTARDYRQLSGVAHNAQGSGRGAEKRGQVAQVVERSPEKAGVGGSTPSLATMFFNHFHVFFQKTWVQLGAITERRSSPSSALRLFSIPI